MRGMQKKKPLNILFSPVVSTFTPSKGKAEGRQGKTRAHLYHYATLGLKLQNIKCGIICQSGANNMIM
jgi:hypothetical protein